MSRSFVCHIYSWRVGCCRDNYHLEGKSWWLSTLLQKWNCRWSFTFTAVLALIQSAETKELCFNCFHFRKVNRETRYGFVKCKQWMYNKWHRKMMCIILYFRLSSNYIGIHFSRFSMEFFSRTHTCTHQDPQNGRL